jgi:beta-galactosidase
VQSLRDAARAGTIVTMGPRAPLLDGAMRPLKRPADVSAFEIEPLDDLAQADALVAKRVDELALPAYPVDPVDVHIAVHEDDAGPRVVFVMNPTSADVAARFSLPGVEELTDLLGDQRVVRSAGAFELNVPARTVRLLGVA